VLFFSATCEALKTKARPFIFSKLDIDINDVDTNLKKFSYGVFLISLVAFLCFINITGNMVAYIIIHKGNY
jgi:hypothetical protein